MAKTVKPLKFGSKRCWSEWQTPEVLYEGQRVRVFRHQPGISDGDPDHVHNPHGHWEEGELQEVFVEVGGGATYPLRVAGVDLRDWWRLHRKEMRSGRPPVGIGMRANTYWLKAYRVEALEPKLPADWPVEKPKPVYTGPSIFDFVKLANSATTYALASQEDDAGWPNDAPLMDVP